MIRVIIILWKRRNPITGVDIYVYYIPIYTHTCTYIVHGEAIPSYTEELRDSTYQPSVIACR